jgi:hypothetical protein
VKVCIHCRRSDTVDGVTVKPSRGLCRGCSNNAYVRESYPVRIGYERYASGGWGVEGPDGLPASMDRPLAPTPTGYLPGTRGKVEVMEARVAQGYAPCHPGDAGAGDGGSLWGVGATDGDETGGDPRELYSYGKQGARPAQKATGGGKGEKGRAHKRIGRAGVGLKLHA